ncbi:hypothetical protein KKG51_01285, partial [Patescibacteria group bacterium]|nr:hypothetical protein [Patescibacteria group bacterium]
MAGIASSEDGGVKETTEHSAQHSISPETDYPGCITVVDALRAAVVYGDEEVRKKVLNISGLQDREGVMYGELTGKEMRLQEYILRRTSGGMEAE